MANHLLSSSIMTDPALTIVYVTSMATLQTIGHGCHIYYIQAAWLLSELEFLNGKSLIWYAFRKLLDETFVKVMQISFTADFMFVFRLDSLSSISILQECEQNRPSSSHIFHTHGQIENLIDWNAKQKSHNKKCPIWLCNEYRPILSETAGRLTTYALTLVSVCKKPEIGETWGNQSSATGRACGNKMMTARMKIPRDHTHQLNASAIIPWSLSIIWSP